MPARKGTAPAFAIIVILVLTALLAPLLAKHSSAPEVLVDKIQAMAQPAPPPPQHDMKHRVWVNRRSGLYYCRKSKYYGRMHPGEYMRQEAALLKGFRPAQGETCP